MATKLVSAYRANFVHKLLKSLRLSRKEIYKFPRDVKNSLGRIILLFRIGRYLHPKGPRLLTAREIELGLRSSIKKGAQGRRAGKISGHLTFGNDRVGFVHSEAACVVALYELLAELEHQDRPNQIIKTFERNSLFFEKMKDLISSEIFPHIPKRYQEEFFERIQYPKSSKSVDEYYHSMKQRLRRIGAHAIALKNFRGVVREGTPMIEIIFNLLEEGDLPMRHFKRHDLPIGEQQPLDLLIPLDRDTEEIILGALRSQGRSLGSSKEAHLKGNPGIVNASKIEDRFLWRLPKRYLGKRGPSNSRCSTDQAPKRRSDLGYKCQRNLRLMKYPLPDDRSLHEFLLSLAKEAREANIW